MSRELVFNERTRSDTGQSVENDCPCNDAGPLRLDFTTHNSRNGTEASLTRNGAPVGPGGQSDGRAHGSAPLRLTFNKGSDGKTVSSIVSVARGAGYGNTPGTETVGNPVASGKTPPRARPGYGGDEHGQDEEEDFLEAGELDNSDTYPEDFLKHVEAGPEEAATPLTRKKLGIPSLSPQEEADAESAAPLRLNFATHNSRRGKEAEITR